MRRGREGTAFKEEERACAGAKHKRGAWERFRTDRSERTDRTLYRWPSDADAKHRR